MTLKGLALLTAGQNLTKLIGIYKLHILNIHKMKHTQNKTRVSFRLDNTIQVFRYGKTKNAKIAGPKVKTVQTYTFSVDQFNYIESHMTKNTKPVFKEFFNLDTANCSDCPFSSNSGNGKCYTHKIMQYQGFLSMVKSVINEHGKTANIPEYNKELDLRIQGLVIKSDYTRFGTYGEPTLHPLKLVASMAILSKSYTGYTHQWRLNQPYNEYLMASVESEQMSKIADNYGWLSFKAVEDNTNVTGVICPASEEGGNASTCAACGLCSGTYGKGNKSVKIIQH